MSTILTFCTANLPASAINRFLEESQQAEYAVPFFSLIRTPDQQEFDKWGTTGPVLDFKTGFSDKNDDELRQYAQQFFAERGTLGSLMRHWMAVLDEQSDAQSAVVLHYGIRKSTWDEIHEEVPDQEIPGNGMLREDGRIWWKFRIPFKHSYSFFTGLEHCDLEILELFCRPEHVGADGVVDTETCDKIIRG